MLYYSIVMVSIGSRSTGSPSLSPFSSGECGNAILQYCYGFNRLCSTGSYSTGSPSVSSFSSGKCAMLLNFSGAVHALSQLTPNLLPIFQLIIIIAM